MSENSKSFLRGSMLAPPNRFENSWLELTVDQLLEEDLKHLQIPPATQFLVDHSKSILTKNNSPDLDFTYSVNPYRGCEHGCSYCYARPTHETLGFDAGISFESKIIVKENAPELLRQALSKKTWKPQTIVMSGVTDCYQPAERRFRLTRQCLEVMLEFKNPVSLITKNILVLRDLDILKKLAQENLVHVCLSITTLRDDLQIKMEPRTAQPSARLRALAILVRENIPASINVAPVIPALNDMEIPQILSAAAQVGITSADYVLLRLPLTVRPVFLDWLQRNFPERYDHVVARIADCREGGLNQSDWKTRTRGSGVYAEHLKTTFRVFAKKYGLNF